MEQLEKLTSDSGDSFGGLHHSHRIINILNKQIEQKLAIVNEKRSSLETLSKRLEDFNQSLNQVSFFNKQSVTVLNY